MKKYTLILIGVIIGAPSGYYGMEAMFGAPYRPESTLALFEKYCLPWMRHKVIEPGPELIDLPHIRSETFWVEPESYSTIMISQRSCAVSDILLPMSDDERQALSEIASDFVIRRFPTLHTDPNHGLDTWDEVKMWMEHPVGDARRWGISLMRVQSTEESSYTDLRVYRSEHTLTQS